MNRELWGLLFFRTLPCYNTDPNTWINFDVFLAEDFPGLLLVSELTILQLIVLAKIILDLDDTDWKDYSFEILTWPSDLFDFTKNEIDEALYVFSYKGWISLLISSSHLFFYPDKKELVKQGILLVGPTRLYQKLSN